MTGFLEASGVSGSGWASLLSSSSALWSSELLPYLEFFFFWVIFARNDLESCYLAHAVGALVLGALSLYQGEQSYFLEHVLVRYSMGYFLGHGVEMVRQNQASATMMAHHALAIILLLGVVLNPEFITIKATSSVLLTEFSTVFLYIWEKRPSEQSLAAFVVTYFASRGLFLGYFVYRVFTTKDPLDAASHIPVGAFHYFTLLLFVLNALYFTSILIPSVPKHLQKLALNQHTPLAKDRESMQAAAS